jgi:hypothetical protein
MKIVIQCASRKDPAAGSFITADGRLVLFVAHPDTAPPAGGIAYKRPDDLSDDGRAWRARVLKRNQNTPAEDDDLLPAYRLYAHDTYRELAATFGVEKLFILSAGWGLIPATFRTPRYDITFAAQADSWKRRRKGDHYDDFLLVPDDADEMIFLGGKDYLPLFCALTAGLKGHKTVFFNSMRTPDLPAGFSLVRYKTSTRTNWHYECARDLLAGRLVPRTPQEAGERDT